MVSKHRTETDAHRCNPRFLDRKSHQRCVEPHSVSSFHLCGHCRQHTQSKCAPTKIVARDFKERLLTSHKPWNNSSHHRLTRRLQVACRTAGRAPTFVFERRTGVKKFITVYRTPTRQWRFWNCRTPLSKSIQPSWPPSMSWKRHKKVRCFCTCCCCCCCFDINTRYGFIQ